MIRMREGGGGGGYRHACRRVARAVTLLHRANARLKSTKSVDGDGFWVLMQWQARMSILALCNAGEMVRTVLDDGRLSQHFSAHSDRKKMILIRWF